jgi:hypothetical protein
MPANWRICCGTARAGVHHHEDGVDVRLVVVELHRLEHHVGDFVGGVGPHVDDLVVALAVGDDALAVLLRLRRLLVGGVEHLVFFCGMIMSTMPMEMPARVACSKPRTLQAVEHQHGLLVAGD